MIEVTQKNKKGVVQILAQYETEEDFGRAYWPFDIIDSFSTSPIMVGSEEVYLSSIGVYIREPIFMKVAYTGKGKIIDPSHLLGIARKYNKQYNRRIAHYWYGGFGGGRRVRGSCMRHMKTTQEFRWEKAWEDEEFAPKCRPKRTHKYLPNVYDDYWRFNQKNWKKYRQHQWKD